MKQYKSSSELKAIAQTHMFGNYKAAIGAYLCMNVMLLSINVIVNSMLPQNAAGNILSYAVYVIIMLLTGIFASGNCYLYLNIACEKPALSTYIFYGFRNGADKAILLQLYIMLMEAISAVPLIVFYIMYKLSSNKALMLLVGLGICILIIGLVYVTIMFIPAFFLLHDFPNYTPVEILKKSYELMQGSFLRGLYLYISFIPMKLLSVLSLGVGALWVEPFIYATLAEFFLDLIKNNNRN